MIAYSMVTVLYSAERCWQHLRIFCVLDALLNSFLNASRN